ncbi:LapA family protein [Roseospirillum parvum]|uniref:Lipopolysaccharide assembly protein A domain-containing protein n=1 Tax=Roseospirillum parvum TaxID=83401 RepID=A0A1G7ZT94_9PROT|nr:LapA family protein [Roseospirillum parvum]SDH11847.1 Protein of unknown function [Roseospirillum parvum]
MRNVLFWLVAGPVGLICIIFAVSNRTLVGIEIWPLPWVVEMPLFLPIYGVLLLGVLFGAVLAWIGGGRTRERLRKVGSRAYALDRDLNQARRRIEELETQTGQANPGRALPPAA